MGLREEQVQMVAKNAEEKEEHVLAALALFGEIIAGQRKQKLMENQDANRIAESDTLKIKEANKIKELYRAIGGSRKLRKKGI